MAKVLRFKIFIILSGDLTDTSAEPCIDTVKCPSSHSFSMPGTNSVGKDQSERTTVK